MVSLPLSLRRGVAVIVLMLSPAAVWAGSLDAAARAEIAYLFDYLEKSGCDFNRNGSWYEATEASKHLHDKYEYLLDKGLLDSTEQFIERAATESSMSGKAYQVRCADGVVSQSADWFGRALTNHRKDREQAAAQVP